MQSRPWHLGQVTMFIKKQTIQLWTLTSTLSIHHSLPNMSLCCEEKPEDPEKGTGRTCRLHRDRPSQRADSLPSPGSPPFLTLLINLYSHCISFIHIMQTYVCKSKCNRTCWHLSNKKEGDLKTSLPHWLLTGPTEPVCSHQSAALPPSGSRQ